MKLNPSILLLALLAALPAQATVLISGSLFGNSSTMPGSPLNYTFFGNPVQFPSSGPDISDNYYSGGNPNLPSQPTQLVNFIAHVGANAQYTYGAQNNDGATDYNPAYGTITAPGGFAGAQKTGILFSAATSAPDLVRFTLGAPTPSFNFSDFDVYVMISNAPTSGLSDADLVAKLFDQTGAVALSSLTLSVTDDGSNATNTANFYDFHITGGVSGDILQLGAIGSPGDSAYLSGVSFKSNTAPEPSTYAMMIGGLALLAFWQSRKRFAFRS